MQTIENMNIKDRFLMNLNNFKARINLDFNMSTNWQSCMNRLINLGDTIHTHIDLFSEEEIMDIIKIYDTASVVHDPIISPLDKEHQLTILENLLTQGEAQVNFILGVSGIKDEPQAQVEEQNVEELEKQFANIKDNIDFFGTRLIFVNREAHQKVGRNSKDNYDFQRKEEYLKTYFKYVTNLYQRLQNVYDIVAAIIQDSGINANQEMLTNLEKLVKVMYRTLGITNTKTMRVNLGIAEDSMKKMEESLSEQLKTGLPHNKH